MSARNDPAIPANNPQVLFNNQPRFKPFYTPQEMLLLGVYGGNFFFKWDARKNLVPMDFTKYVPTSQWEQPAYNDSINFFQIDARGTIYNPDLNNTVRSKHPFGWFQWYAEYFAGFRDQYIDHLRVNEWKTMLERYNFYTEEDEYTGELTPYTDLNWKPILKQRALEYGWDPTIQFSL